MFAEAILSELLLLPPVLKTETITDTMILNIEAIIGPTIFEFSIANLSEFSFTTISEYRNNFRCDDFE